MKLNLSQLLVLLLISIPTICSYVINEGPDWLEDDAVKISGGIAAILFTIALIREVAQNDDNDE
jgi:hypothetical protein